MPANLRTTRYLLLKSVDNIDSLLEDEEDPDIATFLKVAKDALETVRERKGMSA